MYKYEPLCHKVIPIPDTKPPADTYCMLQAGHEGKCSPIAPAKESPSNGRAASK